MWYSIRFHKPNSVGSTPTPVTSFWPRSLTVEYKAFNLVEPGSIPAGVTNLWESRPTGRVTSLRN